MCLGGEQSYEIRNNKQTLLNVVKTAKLGLGLMPGAYLLTVFISGI